MVLRGWYEDGSVGKLFISKGTIFAPFALFRATIGGLSAGHFDDRKLVLSLSVRLDCLRGFNIEMYFDVDMWFVNF